MNACLGWATILSLDTADAPFRLDWQTSAATVEPGESLTLTVRMYDVPGS